MQVSKPIQRKFLCFSEVASKKGIMGVYAIFGLDNEVVYVGSTNKFNVRFGTDLKYESTHTLMKKLLKTGKFKDRKEAVEYLSRHCKFKIEMCGSKREAEALEAMTII